MCCSLGCWIMMSFRIRRLNLPDGFKMRQSSTRKIAVLILLLVILSLLMALSSNSGWTSSVNSPEDSQTETTDLPNKKAAVRSWLPWYMNGGNGGTSQFKGKLFPEDDPHSDRIEEQLRFAPVENGTKLILAFNGDDGWTPWQKWRPGSSYFNDCPVKSCSLIKSKREAERADAILFRHHLGNTDLPKPNGQVWILFMLESPYHTPFIEKSDVFNWTVTYRWDSDIVYPYGKWVYYNESIISLPLAKNYAANKTKQVAWFASNCHANNNRLEYAYELQKYISVDIFGACGTKDCPRSNSIRCQSLLNSDYKFYLAFENSNCADYITEKFFLNGLGNDIIPIAMGAKPEDYARAAPKHSYIHVDDFHSPKALAEFLHKLDKDDDLYNSYFRWKGTGEFINDQFFCRLCALLHSNPKPKVYKDINAWWRGPGVCSKPTQISYFIRYKVKITSFQHKFPIYGLILFLTVILYFLFKCLRRRKNLSLKNIK